MALSFEHRTLPQRIVFRTGGVGEALAEEAVRADATRIMLIASAREIAHARKVTADLPVAVVHTDVAAHVPLDRAAAATAIAREAAADLLIAFGGGSATGLAKFIARETGVPIVAVPTTYAGSEATNIWGQTEAGIKTTGADDRVLPRTVIYDAELTLDLPRELSVSSGMNALAHGIDAMWAPRTDPIARTLAEEGIRVLAASLHAIASDPHDLAAREQTLYGAYMSATAFAASGSGLHHKICHVLGGRFDLPHAQTHTCVLPHVLAANAPFAPEASERIARALGSVDASGGLDRLYDSVAAPRALSTFGYTAADVPESVELILPLVPPSNPRRVTASDLEHILFAALEGARCAD